jgi:hypothetical protein
VSENVDLVRSIYADWERGDWSRAAWADPRIEFVIADGPEPTRSTGIAAMAAIWSNRQDVYDEIHVVAEEFRELDDGRVVVLVRNSGRANKSGIAMEQLGDTRAAAVFEIDRARVTSLALYWEWRRALADLGLEE